MRTNPESGGSVQTSLRAAAPSPLFLETVSRAEARRVLACSIGSRRKSSPSGEKVYVELLAISELTSPAAVAEIGARLNVEIEVTKAPVAEIRELIERVYDEAERPQAH